MQIDHRTALQAMLRLSAEAEIELFHDAKRGPLASVLLRAREDALQALVGLAHVDPANTENVRKLQNEVQRFIDLLAYTKQTLADGDEAAEELRPDDQSELRRLLEEDQAPVPGDDSDG